ncbi:MAG: hypothetical protein GVY10_02745 [Verrucomicrobia bacterium]|jgi:hypothetical protein|nr:hypothetical protein [Verrucomicrobiota bacterium]
MKIPYISKTTSTRGLATVLLAAPLLPASAAILLQEGFETDGEDVRYTVTDRFSDGDADYFIRTDGAAGAWNLPAYSGYTGNWFWAAEDTITDNNPSGLTYIDFTGVPVSGVDAVRLSLQVGAGSVDKYDAVDDFLDVLYRVDGGPWTPALSFQNDGSRFNTHLAPDLDLDGIGEGPPLSLTLDTFTSPDLPVAGSFMDLRIDAVMTSGGESVAFDNLQVATVPEPAFASLLIALLGAAVLPLRRTLSSRKEEA